MWPFKKRKPKIFRHELRDVCTIPAHKDFYRAVKCVKCGKQFIMDVFGGWAVEWTFVTEGTFKAEGTWKVNDDDMKKAVTYFHNKPQREWIQLGFTDICDGRKET